MLKAWAAAWQNATPQPSEPGKLREKVKCAAMNVRTSSVIYACGSMNGLGYVSGHDQKRIEEVEEQAFRFLTLGRMGGKLL